MKKYCFVFIFSLFVISSCQKNKNAVHAKVDKRIELMSIISRIAGFEEYNQPTIKSYSNKINTHFNEHKNHEIFEFIEEMRDSTHLAYDALMTMAIYLDEDKVYETNYPVSEIEKKDNRWTENYINQFLLLLKDFYLKSDFESFFRMNKSLYDSIENEAVKLTGNINYDWFSDTFSFNKKTDFRLILGVALGYGNYGLVREDKEVFYSIIGCGENVDLQKDPFYDDKVPTIIHEYCHSFINPVTAQNKDLFQNAGSILYSKNKKEMNNQAYGDWESVINESLVRAFVIKYMKENNFSREKVLREIAINKKIGFVWIKELVDILDKIQAQIDQKYSNKFITELSKEFDWLAQNIDSIKHDFYTNKSKVISVQPFQNNSTNIATDTIDISFTFDDALIEDLYAIGPVKYFDRFPEYEKVCFSDNHKTITMKNVILEPNKNYEIKLTGKWFFTEDTRNCEDYILKFSTK